MSARQGKAWLKGRFKQVRLAYLRRFRFFDAGEVEQALRDLGVRAGDVVFVHSAYNAFDGFIGKPSEVIGSLEAAVGPEGTVLMPSMPFTGSALDYIQSGKITDIRRTPSRMGLLTELFRRQKDVVRSLHPTHPVLAKGRMAKALIAGHERAATPCGAGSPFGKLLEADGKIVLLGAPIETMTFFHYLEEAHEDKLPKSPFTSDVIDVPVREGDRTTIVTMRLYDRTQSRKRRVSRMLPGLERRGALQTARIGALRIAVIAARDADAVFREMAERGEALYDD